MKKILLSAIALLIYGNSFGQLFVDQKRHYLGFNIGAALPQGNFAESDTKNYKSQYAKTGFNVNLEGAGYFLPFLGIAGSIGGFSNTVNADQYNSNTSSATVNNWLNGYVMAGPIASLPLGKFTIDGKVLFGAVGTKTPDYEISTYLGGKSVTDEKFVVNFGYTVGASIRYNLISRLALKLNCDYISSNQTVKGSTKNYSPGFSEPTSYDEYENKVDVRNINVGLGLVFQFVE